MTESPSGFKHTVLIVGPDSLRAESAGAMVEQTGSSWEYLPRSLSEINEMPWGDFDVIIVMDSAFEQAGSDVIAPANVAHCGSSVLIGLVGPSKRNQPSLLGSGLDMILYEPLAVADIERMHAFVDAIQHETHSQARERLRKMSALHELAVASGHRTGATGWLDRLIDAGRRILGVDALAMWALNPTRDRISCLGSSGLDREYIEATERGSTAFSEEYQTLLRQLPVHDLATNDPSVQTRLTSPQEAIALGVERIAWWSVRDASRVYGHLSFYFMKEGSHKRYDLVLADAFASIVAAALGTFWLQTEIRRSNRLYREQVESSPDGIVVLHLDGTIERSNAAMETITGRDRYAMIGRSIFDWFVNPDELPWGEWQSLDPESVAENVELWLSRESGERRRVLCSARRVRLADPRTLKETEDRIQLVVRDITTQARRLVELELFYALTTLISGRGSIEEAYELVVSRLYNYLNYRFVAIGEIIGRNQLQLTTFRAHSSALFVPPVMSISQGVSGRAIRENRSLLVRDVRTVPDYMPVDDEIVCEIVAVIRADGEPIGVINIETDATQPLGESDLQLAESIAAHLGLLIDRVTVQEQLERQALTDSLTGIANRRAFMQHLNALLEDPESPPAALLLVELDRFKSVNDQYGHLFGDEMLKQVSQRMKSVLRVTDVLARYGGDEIAVISHDMSADAAFDLADRLRNVISDRPFHFNSQVASLTVSIGIALYPFHGVTADELIGEGDRAMYAAKLGGRNMVFGDVAGAN